MKVDVDSLQFVGVVEIVFRGWTAMQLAVQHDFGGPESAEKAKWSTQSVAERIEKNPQIQQYDLSYILEDIMEFEFNTTLEDGSQFEIAKVLLKCHELFSTGKKSELLTFLGHAPIAQISQCEKSHDPNKPTDEDSCSSDSGDDMEVESESSERSISYNLRSKCAVTTPSNHTNLPTVPENVSTSEMTSSQQQSSSSSAQNTVPSSSQMEVDNEDNGWTTVSGKKRTSKRTQNRNADN